MKHDCRPPQPNAAIAGLPSRLRAARSRSEFIDAMNRSIRQALAEDIGTGDITSEAVFTPAQHGTAKLVAKQNGVLAGGDIFTRVFHTINPDIQCRFFYTDGQSFQHSDILAQLHGPVLSLLQAERVALNLLQRACGIATLTQDFVQAAAGRVRILDTRKTVPGLRWLDKYAVLAGGGENHRYGLYDMVLIKENHIQTAGSINQAITAVRNYHAHRPIEIEVEVTTLDELREALSMQPDRILLDNMDDNTLAQAVAITAHTVPLEASGNITLERMPALCDTGIDYVSIGALTHSVQALDLSLLLET